MGGIWFHPRVGVIFTFKIRSVFERRAYGRSEVVSWVYRHIRDRAEAEA